MTMTTTVLDPSVVIEDPVLVVDDEARPDPEVPQRARRRTFTAKYKLEVLAAYDDDRVAPDTVSTARKIVWPPSRTQKMTRLPSRV